MTRDDKGTKREKGSKKPKVKVLNQRYEGATPEMVAKALLKQNQE